MNDFNKIIWGFTFSAIGIAFGWVLNQLSQWFRTRQEDKKNLKVVLFNLLETYFIFIRSDFDKYIQKITDKVLSKMPTDQQTEESKAFMNNLYSSILINHLKPELISQMKSIQVNYKDSIKTLSAIDPLTAYYLSGKTNILETFDTIQNMFDNVKSQFPSEHNEIQASANMVMDILKPDIFKDSLNDLEKEIKSIALKINPFLWFKSIRAIKRLKRNINQKLDNDLDELFEKLSPLVDLNN